jgi:hypothetical protein
MSGSRSTSTSPADERRIEEWMCHCPRDVDTKVAFYTQKEGRAESDFFFNSALFFSFSKCSINV